MNRKAEMTEIKTLETLKKEVLFAYLNLQVAGQPKKVKAQWERKYEEARHQLAEQIEMELNSPTKKDLSQ